MVAVGARVLVGPGGEGVWVGAWVAVGPGSEGVLVGALVAVAGLVAVAARVGEVGDGWRVSVG